MTIQIASDLHNEFGQLDFKIAKADLIILAGDVNVGMKGLDWLLSKNIETPIIYILGNHEYYSNAYPKLIGKLKTKAEGTNVRVMENEALTFNDVTFHCATLWTSFEIFGDPRIAGYEAQQKMNDYKKIRVAPAYSKLRSLDTHRIHHRTKLWLERSLDESKTLNNVVVTHHAPSTKSVPEHFRDDILSAAYASDLEPLILDKKPNLWIHGHIHQHSDYQIGDTRILCNPRGYPDEPQRGWKEKFTLEIGV